MRRADRHERQCVPDPTLPFGLRTVDGSFNNLIAGREGYGAADRSFPRLATPEWSDAEAAPTSPGHSDGGNRLGDRGEPDQHPVHWQIGEAGEGWEPSLTGDNLPDAPNGLVDTFTPGDGDGASLLRVIVSFEDDVGQLRTIVSDALTEVVNVNKRASPTSGSGRRTVSPPSR